MLALVEKDCVFAFFCTLHPLCNDPSHDVSGYILFATPLLKLRFPCSLAKWTEALAFLLCDSRANEPCFESIFSLNSHHSCVQSRIPLCAVPTEVDLTSVEFDILPIFLAMSFLR